MKRSSKQQSDLVRSTAGWLGGLGRDLRIAARALRHAPVFSVIAMVSLASGLALATTTLAITNAYLIRGLPYPDAKRIYHLRYAPPGPHEPRGMNSLDWESVSDVVDATIIGNGDAYYLGDDASTEFIRVTRASPGFIEGLGVRPVLGRVFSPDEYKPGSPEVALLGHGLWRNRFNSDPAIIGREIRVRPENLSTGPKLIRIVGVLPPGFWFGRTSDVRTEMLVPLRVPARPYMVRLREGVPVALAQQRITEAARAVGSDFGPNWPGIQLEGVNERYVAELRPLLFGINAATLVVFILVCANVAILILLRALRRQKEVAVRVALGAERRHLLRMLIAEAGLICVGAVINAVALTAVALRTLAPVIEARLGRPPPAGTSTIGVDVNVALMIGGVGLLVALSMALIPMLASRRRQLADSLRRGGHGATDGPGMRRLRSTLIAFEVAGALVLLVGGGLMIRSVLNLVQTDLGFDPEHVVRIGVVLPSTYRDRNAMAQFYSKVGERLATTNSVSALSSSFPPFYETHKRTLESDTSGEEQMAIGGLPVGPGYFAVHGIPVQQGREFSLADRFEAQPVAVVSASLARQLWPAENAIGRRIRAIEESVPETPLGPWRTIVGVVRDVRQTYNDHDLRDLYFPFLQSPTRYANVQVRTDRLGTFPLKRLAALVAEIDPFVRVSEPKLLADEDQQFARARFMTALLGGFAGFASLLALLGIYGVTAYAVRQREREIAIRIALGATDGAVVRMFLRDSGVVLAVGLGLGLVGAFASGRIIESQIHGVQPFDGVTLVAACAFLAACGLLATWWPLRSAAIGDVISLLKAE